MARFWKIAVFIALLLLSGGCTAKTHGVQKSSSRTVVRIEISGKHAGSTITLQYEDQKKMNKILNYLRALRSEGTRRYAPVQTADERYEILLYYANGEKSCWKIFRENCFCKGDAPWQVLNPKRTPKLYPLLHTLPSDKAI